MKKALALCLALCVSGIFAAPAEQADTVSIAFVGDVMLAEAPGRTIARGGDPFRHFAKMLASADLRVANLESVVATKGSPQPGKIYAFLAHPRVLGLLKTHFDAVTLANNHSGDYGPDAFVEMLGLLRERGIPYFGGGNHLREAHAPLVVQRRGLKIAFLGYNEFLPRSFEADFDQPGVAWSEDDQVVADIAQARRMADLVIPVMHWGWEYERLASARQRQLARLMIDAGADAVVGGHPHVTQDVEFYKGKPVIYSLGNFVFNGFKDEAGNTGWLLKMDMDRSGVRQFQIISARIDPATGTPRPLPPKHSQCWQRGQAVLATCAH